jgi:hypothetical protein
MVTEVADMKFNEEKKRAIILYLLEKIEQNEEEIS